MDVMASCSEFFVFPLSCSLTQSTVVPHSESRDFSDKPQKFELLKELNLKNSYRYLEVKSFGNSGKICERFKV